MFLDTMKEVSQFLNFLGLKTQVQSQGLETVYSCGCYGCDCGTEQEVFELYCGNTVVEYFPIWEMLDGYREFSPLYEGDKYQPSNRVQEILYSLIINEYIFDKYILNHFLPKEELASILTNKALELKKGIFDVKLYPFIEEIGYNMSTLDPRVWEREYIKWEEFKLPE